MSQFHTQIEVARGIEETFAFVSDFRNTRKWDPHVRDASMLTPEPIGLASMFRLVGGIRPSFMDFNAPVLGELALPYQVVCFDPPAPARDGARSTARVRLEGQTSVLRYVDIITFTGDAKTTTIDYDAILQLSGRLSLLDRFSPRLAARVGASATKGLAAAIEANVPATLTTTPQAVLEAEHAP